MGHLLNQVKFMKILTVRNIKWFYMSEHNISVTNARLVKPVKPSAVSHLGFLKLKLGAGSDCETDGHSTPSSQRAHPG